MRLHHVEDEGADNTERSEALETVGVICAEGLCPQHGIFAVCIVVVVVSVVAVRQRQRHISIDKGTQKRHEQRFSR